MKIDPKKVIAVIPARMGSTRLPNKPLADIAGKPMVVWVMEAARKARGVDDVIVATDDVRILQVVETFGGKAMMTPESLASGTDRVAAVAEVTDAEFYLNVQGDEPLIEPSTIESVVELVKSGRFPMASVMTELRPDELETRSVVKVSVDRHGKAIYFSRLPLPVSFRHLGLYAYRRETLFHLRSLPRSPREIAESLEQLRALDEGISIGLVKVESRSIGVDLPADLEVVRARLTTAL